MAPTIPCLTSFLWPDSSTSPRLVEKLESYRIKYEKINGPTDITRQYSLMLDSNQQEWLAKNYPDHFLAGMPPYVKAFLRTNMDLLASKGKLDFVNSAMLLSGYVRKSFDCGDGHQH